MALPPVTNTIRIAMEFTKDGQSVVNIYYVKYPSPIVTANLSLLAQAFKDWWTNTLKTYATQQLQLTAVRALDISVLNGEEHQLIVSPAEPGSITGEGLPNNCAMVVTKLTLNTGRSFRGRTYLANIAESNVAGNVIDTTFVANVVAAFVTLRATLTAGGLSMVVVSYYTNGVVRTTPVATPITGFRADTRVDSQRRRLPGYGS